MFYKVLKNGEIIDVLSELIYLKYNTEYHSLRHATKSDAQLFLSSDSEFAWHDFSLRRLPKEANYDTVELVKISDEEYLKIKHLSRKKE